MPVCIYKGRRKQNQRNAEGGPLILFSLEGFAACRRKFSRKAAFEPLPECSAAAKGLTAENKVSPRLNFVARVKLFL